MLTQPPDELLKEIQSIIRKTPVLIIGSGHSSAFGLPGMSQFASHIDSQLSSCILSVEESKIWERIRPAVIENLELGLNHVSQGDPGADSLLERLKKITTDLFRDASIDAFQWMVTQSVDNPNFALARLIKRLFEGAPQNQVSIVSVKTPPPCN